MKKALFRLADELGLGRKLIEEHDSLTSKYQVDREIQDYSVNKPEGTILMPLEGNYQNVFRHGVLAHAFKTRGYQPLILTHSDLGRLYQTPSADRADKVSQKIRRYRTKNILSEFGLQYKKTSSFLPDDYEEPEISIDLREYKGIDIASVALSTCRKYFRRYTLNLEKEAHREAYLDFLKACVTILDACENIFEQKDIKASLVHDPVYLNKLYSLTAVNQDIPAFSLGGGYRNRTLLFGNYENRVPQAQFTDPKTLEKQVNKQLNEKQKEVIDRIMDKRVEGASLNNNFIKNADKSIETGSEQTFAVFTNLMWDASLETKQNLFESPYDWLENTIQEFGGEENFEVIIKCHPGEAMRNTNEEVKDWISENYSTLPDNFHILEPDTDVSPYKLMEDIDFGVVWNSTIGLEMTYYGTPVVVVGDTHYKKLGFTYDPETKEEYFELLRSRLEMSEEMSKRAKRYAYFLFAVKHIDYPFYEAEDGQKILVPARHKDIKPGNENFDAIVKNVLRNQPVTNQNEPLLE